MITFISSQSFGQSIFYVVKEDDNLSQLANKLSLSPIYGKKGVVAEVAKDNKIKDENLIRINQEIKFREIHRQSILSKANILDNGEIVFFQKNKPVEIKITQSEPIREISSEPQAGEPVVLDEAPKKKIAKKLKAGKKHKRSSKITAKAISSTYELNGHDNSNATDGYLNSDNAIGYEISWEQGWTKRFSTSLSARQDFIKFNPFSASNKTFKNNQVTLSNFSLGAKYRVTNPFALGVILSREDQLIYKASSPTEFSLLKAAATTVTVDGNISLFSNGGLNLGLNGQYTYISKFSIDGTSFNAGSGYKAAAVIRQEFGSLSLIGEGFYQARQYSSQNADYKFSNIGAKLGLELSLK